MKWIEALALLFLAGQVLVSRLARREPQLAWVKPGFHAASVALSAGLVVVWAQATVGSGGHSLPDYLAYFDAGLSGAALIARLVLEALTLLAVVRGWRTLLPLFLGATLVLLAAAGHAAGVQPAWLGIGTRRCAPHRGGALGRRHRRAGGWSAPRGWRSADARRLLGRFTPVALAAFGTTVVAGGLEAILQLGSLQSLFGTDYGRVLLAKMALVACMLPLSLMAWRLGRPHVRIEASIAICVVGAAALLASFPAPPTTAEQQAAESAAVDPTAGLPAAGELTMAGPAGSVLVGLSLSPGLPGPNRATVYVLPITGSAAAQALLANISVNSVYTGAQAVRRDVSPDDHQHQSRRHRRCGRAQRRWRRGLVHHPAASGSVRRDDPRAHGHGDALAERLPVQRSPELGHDQPSAPTTHQSLPTRRHGRSPAPARRLSSERSQYTRDAPGDAWHTESDLSPNIVPVVRLGFLRAAEQRARCRATPSSAASRRPSSPPSGTRMDRRSGSHSGSTATGSSGGSRWTPPGHFMTDTYTSYNHPPTIEAPATG